MEKILTISVAAYNAEKYIDKTLESIANCIHVEALEVFVIDDGGTDKTISLAKEYEKRYPGVFYPIHKENGGYGSTVNYSIKNASGKYFKLLDGDDWMDTRGLDKLIDLLINVNNDVIITDYFAGESEDNCVVVSNREKNNLVVKADAYDTKYPHGMWAICYKTVMLKGCNLILPEHSLYTDQLYSVIPFNYADTILFTSIPVYFYRIGRDGQSTSAESRIKHLNEMINICELTYNFYESEKPNSPYILTRISRFYTLVIKTMLLPPHNKTNKMKIIEYEKKAKKEHRRIYDAATQRGGTGTYIKALRVSNYALYNMIEILPDRIKRRLTSF